MGECDPFHKTIFHFVLVCPYCPLDIVGDVWLDYLMNKKGTEMNYKELLEAQTKQRAKEMIRINQLLEASFANRNPRPINNDYELHKLER